MKNGIFIGIVLLTILMLVTLYVAFSVYFAGELTDYTEDIEKNIGKHVIFNSDTVQIIDYSLWTNTYTLSNGQTIATTLCNHLDTVAK